MKYRSTTPDEFHVPEAGNWTRLWTWPIHSISRSEILTFLRNIPIPSSWITSRLGKNTRYPSPPTTGTRTTWSNVFVTGKEMSWKVRRRTLHNLLLPEPKSWQKTNYWNSWTLQQPWISIITNWKAFLTSRQEQTPRLQENGTITSPGQVKSLPMPCYRTPSRYRLPEATTPNRLLLKATGRQVTA